MIFDSDISFVERKNILDNFNYNVELLKHIIGIKDENISMGGYLFVRFDKIKNPLLSSNDGLMKPYRLNVNLIKIGYSSKNNLESFFHEWFHYLDRQLNINLNAEKLNENIKLFSDNEQYNPKYKEIKEIINNIVSPDRDYVKQSILLDDISFKDININDKRLAYYSRNSEIMARSFEIYIIEKVKRLNINTKYNFYENSELNIMKTKNPYKINMSHTIYYIYPTSLLDKEFVLKQFDILFEKLHEIEFFKNIENNDKNLKNEFHTLKIDKDITDDFF